MYMYNQLQNITISVWQNNNCLISPKIQAVYGLWYFDESITAWELVEVVDNVCMRAYMQFYLI